MRKIMSDLISRSALIEAMTEVYKKHYAGTGKSEDFTIAMEMVRKQPTAYDVEKVVAELEEHLLVVEIEDEHIIPESDVDEYFELDVVAMSDAIDIVKRGGVE
jgi:hypothetical protein